MGGIRAVRVAIIGANGQLGSDVLRVFSTQPDLDPIPLTHADIEITDPDSIAQALGMEPEVVINTAAWHGARAETEMDISFRVNAVGPKLLADWCRGHNAALVHISTDYVFDGKTQRPYTEDDPPCPVNIYGISKLAGELVIQALMERYYIVRVSGLYGVTGSRAKGDSNFVELMLSLAGKEEEIRVVDDQVLTPTYTRDVAECLARLIHTEAHGLYHMTNAGHCSWYEFACAIFRLAGLPIRPVPKKTDWANADAQRPAYSVLENAHLKQIGLPDLRPWQAALQAYLAERRTRRAQ